MSKEVSVLDKKLPAHLQQLSKSDAVDDWASGTASGFPVLSTKSKVWSIKRGDSTEVITRENSDGEQEEARSISVVILRSNKGVARTYYKTKYVEGSDEAPSCYSNDGVRPSMEAEDRQAKSCAACPHSKWGSVITESGKKGKACSEVKRLAVAPAGQLNDPMLLRIPPTSLKSWDQYVMSLAKRGLNPTHMITKVGFDSSVSHQLLTWKPMNFVNEEMVTEINETAEMAVIEQIIGVENETADQAAASDDAAAAEPPAKTPAKRSAKKPADDGSDEDDAPPPAKKAPAKKAPAKKAPAKKPAPEPDSDEDASADESDDSDDDIPELDLDDLDLDDDSDDA